MADRYRVLGLAPSRAGWFGDVARWAMAGLVPLDFVQCVSASEVKARLRDGPQLSAVLLDAGSVEIDRDLLSAARRAGAVPIIVGEDPRGRDLESLGGSTRLPRDLTPEDLIALLRDAAAPLVEPLHSAAQLTPPDRAAEQSTPDGWQGRLVAVLGAGGAGASTVAMCLAQGLADDPANSGSVLLADLALNGDLGAYHDSDDVVPGVQELVEGHRGAHLGPAAVREMVQEVPSRRYDLLLGLRRPSDWVALGPRAVGAALQSLTGAYRSVVADITPEWDGEELTGSEDVEERNALARRALATAGVAVVVASPTMVGTRRMLHLLAGLRDAGFPSDRILRVFNRAPRSPAVKADISRAVAELSADPPLQAAPIFLPEQRRLEPIHRTVDRLPRTLCGRMASAVEVVDAAATSRPGSEKLGDGVPASSARRAVG